MAEAERMPGPEAITEFWSWWNRIREPLAEAIRADRAQEFVEPLRDRLGALHPDLRFSLRPGLQAAHALSITGATPRADDIAHTVLDGAPADDEHWEYSGLSLPVADPATMTCVVGDLTIEMSGARVAVEHFPDLGAVVVQFFHPVLAGLAPELVEDVLDSALSAVVGRVEPARTRIIAMHVEREPADALDLSELRLFLDRLV
ncbi:hypothetical protein [Saccharopolyspora taberi]|uniref:PAS domain-containing protein n=1 Tax=Saccharopolyspora taberi TaxID=60895 RepID=A0ABN3VHC8_9PSEU